MIAPSPSLRGKQSAALHGSFTVEEAVTELLKGSGLTARLVGRTIFIQARSDTGATSIDVAPEGSSDIVVTGTRIRGAPPTSPVTTLSAEAIRRAGQSDLGEAVRALPQNFGGGQNPGVAPGAIGASNSNQNSASSLNLRGLGPDATLTLLNGHRLAYGSSAQAVDINAIPLTAVDRIEIVGDGASALYGSDAVGGVANIILKKDYSGVATTARFGAATDGGDEQQQYSIVGGTNWGTGGFIATYDFERDTAITARQRAYTGYMPDDNTLLPSLKRHSALLSLHQAIIPALTFSLDTVYNRRRSRTVLEVPGSISYLTRPLNTSFVIAPSLKFDITPGWSAALSGVYGKDRTATNQVGTTVAGVSTRTTGCLCNTIRSVEASTEGLLLHLPGGDVRVALGGGYRYNGFSSVLAAARISAKRDSYYGYGEVFVPFVGPDQSIKGIYRLSLNAALRYEDYPGIDHVATPKVGLIYAPSADFDLKGSWGKSFKAATLFQQFQPQYAYLYAARTLGATGLPANATALLTFGGNAGLKPERATTWTGTLALHPRAVEGARIEISYFHIDYRDRVTQPIQGTNFFTALAGTAYRDFIQPFPSAQLQADTINASAAGFFNFAGTAYVPANVVALISDTYLNAARQRIEGIDVAGEYRVDLASGDAVALTASGSWLRSSERLSPSLPRTQLAGTIFNPAHFKARLGATWIGGPLSIAAFANHVGGSTDTRSQPRVHVGSQTTADLAVVYRSAEIGPVRNVDLLLSVRNLLNDKPPYARPVAVYYVNYDSTNHSAIGRFISFAVTKHW